MMKKTQSMVIDALIDDMITKFSPSEFEEFIKFLLKAMKFGSKKTPDSGDKGVDVIGTMSAGSLADVKIKIQVKKYARDRKISNDTVLQLRGTLAPGEYGCVITTSSFTSKAVSEANDCAKGKTEITLINGIDLAKLVLMNFDKISNEYPDRFSIRRRLNIPPEESFEVVDSRDDVKEELSEESMCTTTEEDDDFNTIVCPAYDGGVEKTFIPKKAWWAVKIADRNKSKICNIAIYQSSPTSAITHWGKVGRIADYDETGKCILYLEGEPKELTNYVKKPGGKPGIQGTKYTTLDKLLNAKTLDDL
ncbi:MAG TPA: restriction endonuclease [Caldisericia bacterium]|nr:restriction endonuclease [Caldisericia bacterium]HPI84574.1 restriction endonuclease [Caldisericia bacterium]HPQ93410.1 restriction endonuclease [Caldisericia bacterium]